MPSTHRHHTTSYAAYALLLLAMSTNTMAADQAASTMTYKGCFSSSNPLKNQGKLTFQSQGKCQETCIAAKQAVLGLTGGDECWCGDELPAAGTKVDDNKCNTPCDGYDIQNCGGDGYWMVYLSGTEDNVGSVGSADGTDSAAPSVVTHITPKKTVIVTQQASAGASSSNSGSGTNMTAVAAGVVVAVVIISAILAALFFWLRHRRREAAEEEYKRTQISEFMRGGGRPPQTGYSSTSDSRLDPEYGKRNSVGSIADNEDYSRKILRVANPDRS